jgi:hypothetical protein
MYNNKSKSQASEEKKKQPQGRRFFVKKPDGEKEESIPILKYGKENNFYLFQQALYKKELKEYGD